MNPSREQVEVDGETYGGMEQRGIPFGKHQKNLRFYDVTIANTFRQILKPLIGKKAAKEAIGYVWRKVDARTINKLAKDPIALQSGVVDVERGLIKMHSLKLTPEMLKKVRAGLTKFAEGGLASMAPEARAMFGKPHSVTKEPRLTDLGGPIHASEALHMWDGGSPGDSVDVVADTDHSSPGPGEGDVSVDAGADLAQTLSNMSPLDQQIAQINQTVAYSTPVDQNEVAQAQNAASIRSAFQDGLISEQIALNALAQSIPDGGIGSGSPGGFAASGFSEITPTVDQVISLNQPQPNAPTIGYALNNPQGTPESQAASTTFQQINPYLSAGLGMLAGAINPMFSVVPTMAGRPGVLNIIADTISSKFEDGGPVSVDNKPRLTDLGPGASPGVAGLCGVARNMNRSVVA